MAILPLAKADLEVTISSRHREPISGRPETQRKWPCDDGKADHPWRYQGQGKGAPSVSHPGEYRGGKNPE
jgi:hypothetical protein